MVHFIYMLVIIPLDNISIKFHRILKGEKSLMNSFWAPSYHSKFVKESISQWRSDAGMDNSIADHLEEMFQQVGLKGIFVTPQHEIIKQPDLGFQSRIGIWADTASSRGPQMERDGFITENEYRKVEREYREWMIQDAQYLKMYMLAVEGVKFS